MTPRFEAVATRLGQLRCARAGEGPPLVLLHGNGHAWHEFEPAFGPLAQAFEVIAWDMPGHGASDELAAPPAIEAYADALADMVAALKLRRPLVAGSSVGAFIAAAHAARGGEISGLVLAEMQLRPRDWWLAAWPVVERMFGEPVQAREQIAPRFQSATDEARVARWNADRLRVGGEGLIGVMAAIRDFDLAGALGRLGAPTLALYGAQGPAVETAPALRAASPGATVRIIEGAGHFISIDQPQAFAAAIGAFAAHATENAECR